MSKRAAIYCRAATPDATEQQQQYTAQEERCVHFAQLHGWEITRHFYEHASGTMASRPQLNQLLTAAEAGEVDVVIVSDLARLARSLTVYVTIRQRLTAHGVELAIVDYRDRQQVDEMIATMTKAR